jgi:acyl-coenzyme A thioesterase PaaI-like protein
MKTSFMQAASAPLGGRLIGRGRLLHRTRKLAFTEGGVYDPEGRLCAHATGTFKYVPRRGTDALQTD